MSEGGTWLGARCGAWGALAGVALFALLAHQVLRGSALIVVDAQLTAAMLARRGEGLTQAMLALAWLHDTARLLAATALLAAWRAWRRDWRSVAALGAVPTAMLLNVGLKHLFGRIRPLVEEPLLVLATFSFPSGHAVASTAFWGTACALLLAHQQRPSARAAAVLGACLAVALVCFARLYLGVHFLTDVVAGASVGFAWVCAWQLLAARLGQQESGRPSRASGAASPRRSS